MSLKFVACKPDLVSNAFVIMIFSGNITFNLRQELQDLKVNPIKRHPSKSHVRISCPDLSAFL